MENMKRIIVASDLTDRSGRASLRALSSRIEWDCDILFVHIIPSGLPVRTAVSRAQEARAFLGKVIGNAVRRNRRDLHVEVAVGDPASELARIASQCRDTLLMAGQHGRAAAMAFRHSTTLMQIVARCASPVLVVGNSPKGAYQRPIAALSLGPESSRVLQLAAALVQAARLPALHAFDETDGFELGRDTHCSPTAAERLKQIWSSIGADQKYSAGRHCRPILRRGDTAAIIRRAVHALHADLLVVGRHTHSVVERSKIGSITRGLLWSPPADLLIVGGEAETGRVGLRAKATDRVALVCAA